MIFKPGDVVEYRKIKGSHPMGTRFEIEEIVTENGSIEQWLRMKNDRFYHTFYSADDFVKVVTPEFSVGEKVVCIEAFEPEIKKGRVLTIRFIANTGLFFEEIPHICFLKRRFVQILPGDSESEVKTRYRVIKIGGYSQMMESLEEAKKYVEANNFRIQSQDYLPECKVSSDWNDI